MRFIIPTLIIVLLVMVILPIGYQSVWDGSFELTVDVDIDETVDDSSILFATCWFEKEVDHLLLEDGMESRAGFHPPDVTDSGELVVDVRCSGRDGAYGIGSTYHQQKFLVVDYHLKEEAGGQSFRKDFTIPEGRGPHRMVITIP